jgi:hypothetical protein
VSFVVPIRHDIALHNLNTFENYETGTESDWIFFAVPRRTTFLASIGYGFQRFYSLNKNENIDVRSIRRASLQHMRAALQPYAKM